MTNKQIGVLVQVLAFGFYVVAHYLARIAGSDGTPRYEFDPKAMVDDLE